MSTVETLSAERLEWFLAAAAENGDEPRLVLTAERLRAPAARDAVQPALRNVRLMRCAPVSGCSPADSASTPW